MASWGSMAQDARQVLTMHLGQLLLPTICICITIFPELGEGIGDAFNPKKTRGEAYEFTRNQPSHNKI